MDEATKLFEEAIRLAKEIDNSYSRSQALSSIAQYLAQSGKMDEATDCQGYS